MKLNTVGVAVAFYLDGYARAMFGISLKETQLLAEHHLKMQEDASKPEIPFLDEQEVENIWFIIPDHGTNVTLKAVPAWPIVMFIPFETFQRVEYPAIRQLSLVSENGNVVVQGLMSKDDPHWNQVTKGAYALDPIMKVDSTGLTNQDGFAYQYDFVFDEELVN